MNKLFNLENDFRNYSELCKNNLIEEDDILWYQEFRYFDSEYSEQEKLRQEYSAKKFIESIVKENSRTYAEEIETDNFFYERFLRRQ